MTVFAFEMFYLKSSRMHKKSCPYTCTTGELGYDEPLYDRFLHMRDDMLGPNPMHIKYLSYVYNIFCI